jgi:hydroxymethylbilane synthase
MRLTIASRRSELARIQAYQVGDALQAAHPSLEIDYSFHESLGDRNQNDPLWQMPEKGVFTQDFRKGLLKGEFDLVVHSWKDLTIDDDPETEIAATLPRADARDLLLLRADRWPQVERTGAMSILTSSPRRAYNLNSFLPGAVPAVLKELNFVNVRGNVPTRLRKLFQTEVDGLIVAKAALDRLLEAKQEEFAATQAELRMVLSRCRWMVLPLSANPAAPAQGALAIEIVRERNDLRELLTPINCIETFTAAAREREILSGYGGGCHQKIGVSVLRRSFGQITSLRGLTDDGTTLKGWALRPSMPRPPKVPKEKMWPLEPSDGDWFTRERIGPRPGVNGNALWLAKADALPNDWQAKPEQIIWVSGLQSWKRLAQRGVWVNGSAESLGEHEAQRIETIAGCDLKWQKLTHADSDADSSMPVVATYRLIPKNGKPNLAGKSYFFWKSGSSFNYALSHNPGLRQMTHFCGPGNTQGALRQQGIEPFVFLDHAQWLEEMSL